MTIKIDLGDDTVLHLSNDAMESDGYVEMWLSKEATLHQEAVIVPVAELYIAAQAFIEQASLNRKRDKELSPITNSTHETIS